MVRSIRPAAGTTPAAGASLNVANFTQDVDGSTNATDAYTGTEQAAVPVCRRR